MLTCKEAARAIGQDDLRTGSPTTRLRLRLHLLMCRYCRRYAAQIRAIGKAARSALRDQSVDTQSHERLRERILKDSKADATRKDP